MQLIITGKNMNVSTRTEEFITRKMNRLERHLHEPFEARVELSQQNTRNVNERQIVQVTLSRNGTIIRAEERAADLKVAVESAVDKLDRQLQRYKNKQVRKRRADGETIQSVKDDLAQGEIEPEPRIVRTKRFRAAPMSAEEAIDQMELLGHSFYLFMNQESGDVNVLYRRTDGNYGVLEPQVN
ncbi:MAG: ribosome-associated translation inhibitor RaiA [Anaerolineae bacterium]|nr:ribosome-associated translation inhibitor RaiA [Anaerolineae bacterium]